MYDFVGWVEMPTSTRIPSWVGFQFFRLMCAVDFTYECPCSFVFPTMVCLAMPGACTACLSTSTLFKSSRSERSYRSQFAVQVCSIRWCRTSSAPADMRGAFHRPSRLVMLGSCVYAVEQMSALMGVGRQGTSLRGMWMFCELPLCVGFRVGD